MVRRQIEAERGLSFVLRPSNAHGVRRPGYPRLPFDVLQRVLSAYEAEKTRGASEQDIPGTAALFKTSGRFLLCPLICRLRRLSPFFRQRDLRRLRRTKQSVLFQRQTACNGQDFAGAGYRSCGSIGMALRSRQLRSRAFSSFDSRPCSRPPRDCRSGGACLNKGQPPLPAVFACRKNLQYASDRLLKFLRFFGKITEKICFERPIAINF